MKYLITGGSGLVGNKLTELILSNNEEVNWLTSSSKSKHNVQCYNWNIQTNEIDLNCFEKVDTIIHLAGAGIADKSWSKKRKKELIESRIKTTHLLFNAVKNLQVKPHTIIAASAIGIYKDFENNLIDEESEYGTDFLAKLTIDWEQAVNEFEKIGIRVIKLRIGIVLSKDGGYLKKLTTLAKYGLSAAFGNGKMLISWIHITDLANMFLFAAKNKNINGNYNAVAPIVVTNYEMTKQISKALKRPFFLPNIPTLVFKLMFGEMSEVILMSRNISANKIINTKFKFEFLNIKDALNNLFQKH